MTEEVTSDNVLRPAFTKGAVDMLQDDLMDVLEKYSNRLTVTDVVGVLEVVKYNLFVVTRSN